MKARKGLVLDANILLRAVLGSRVRALLETYENSATYYSPDVCFQDAERYLERELRKRNRDVKSGFAALAEIGKIVHVVDRALYGEFEQIAMARIRVRDPDDWPVVAVALLTNLPIWTEDQDLFGSGIATWTTDRIELFLE